MGKKKEKWLSKLPRIYTRDHIGAKKKKGKGKKEHRE